MTGRPKRPSSRGFIATTLRRECGLNYRELFLAFFLPDLLVMVHGQMQEYSV
jgi:hypothetical protein